MRSDQARIADLGSTTAVMTPRRASACCTRCELHTDHDTHRAAPVTSFCICLHKLQTKTAIFLQTSVMLPSLGCAAASLPGRRRQERITMVTANPSHTWCHHQKHRSSDRAFVPCWFPEVFIWGLHIGVQLVVTLGDTRMLCFSAFVCAYGISSKARPRPRMSRSGIGPVKHRCKTATG